MLKRENNKTNRDCEPISRDFLINSRLDYEKLCALLYFKVITEFEFHVENR